MSVPAACLLAGTVVLLAGCGTTTTVVKTRYVHPCASAKQMTACVGALIRASVKAAGDVATVKVDCEMRGTGFSCLRLLDYGSDQTDCARWLIRRVGPGIPMMAGGATSFDCARWTT